MVKKGIEDHGYASSEDSRRAVLDFEGLFDPHFILRLRQLVGAGLLREQEVFYLPKPDEQLLPLTRHSRPVANEKMLSRALDDSSSILGSPIGSIRSPAASQSLLSKDFAPKATASNMRSDDGNDGRRVHKKLKLSPVGEDIRRIRRPKARRTRRIAFDAAEYKPAQHEEQSTSKQSMNLVSNKRKREVV